MEIYNFQLFKPFAEQNNNPLTISLNKNTTKQQFTPQTDKCEGYPHQT